MKTDEIKQMAEAKAMEKYPKSSNAFIDKLCRGAYAEAIIDTYKEPERVNEKLVEVVKLIVKDVEHLQKTIPLGSFQTFIDNVEALIQSAQQQEKQTKEK